MAEFKLIEGSFGYNREEKRFVYQGLMRIENIQGTGTYKWVPNINLTIPFEYDINTREIKYFHDEPVQLPLTWILSLYREEVALNLTRL